jgi:molecular chaperone GrpE
MDTKQVIDEDIVEEQEDQADNQEVEDNAKIWESKYYRALADYQNLEKRVRDERSEIIRASNRELVLRFLPILDTLELAQKHEENSTLKVVIDQFSATLKSDGVVKIQTLGEKYDPMTMEVVTTGKGKEGVVIQEVRTGYLLHDKLLRPAQVIVGDGLKEKEQRDSA